MAVEAYVSVNEKEFWKAESLQLTNVWTKLNYEIGQAVKEKIKAINAKLDADYDVSILDKWKYDVSDTKKPRLIEQLKNIVAELNVEITRLIKDYGDRSQANANKIREDLSEFFVGKYLSFHNEWSTFGALKSVKDWLKDPEWLRNPWGVSNWEIVNNPIT